MNDRPRHISLLRLCLPISSGMMLLYSPQFDSAVQTLQTSIERLNPWRDKSIPIKFAGMGFDYSDEDVASFPKDKDLVVWAFPEERTECSGNPKTLPQLPLRYIPPQFKKCLAEIYPRTHVPILLPTKGFSKWNNFVGLTYIEPQSVNAWKYSIGITFLRGSRYHGNFFDISGEKITPHTPTPEALSIANNAKEIRFPFPAISYPITLFNGITGYYFRPKCGAGCIAAYGRIIWEQNGYQYRIGIRMGRENEVVEVVNSAIENQL